MLLLHFTVTYSSSSMDLSKRRLLMLFLHFMLSSRESYLLLLIFQFVFIIMQKEGFLVRCPCFISYILESSSDFVFWSLTHALPFMIIYSLLLGLCRGPSMLLVLLAGPLLQMHGPAF